MLENRMPRVGEIVLFTSSPSDEIAKSNSNHEPIPAIITRVWGQFCVNLKIVPDCGPMQDRTSVVHSSQNPASYHFNYVKEEEESIDSYGMKLVSFGNFLLGKYYVKDDIGEQAFVSDADFENWKETL